MSASLCPASNCSIRLLTLAAIISFAVCLCCGCLGFGVDGLTVVALVFMGASSLALAVAFHAMRGMYLHAERLLAKAGVARRNGEGYLPPLKREPKAERKGRSAAEVCTSEARKIGETPCAARSGQSPLAGLSTLPGAERRNCQGGRCGKERPAEVGSGGCGAAADGRRLPPHKSFYLLRYKAKI